MAKQKLTCSFIEFPATVDGRLGGPLSRDVYSLFRLPSRCCDLLAACARRAGHRAVAFTPALRKGGRLTSRDWEAIKNSDVVGLSVITRTAPPSYEAAALIRRLNPRAKIIFGGPHASALPEEAARFADVVVLREGDHTIVELLERFGESLRAPSLADVPGIVYRDGEELRQTAPRPYLNSAELDALPLPVFPPYVRRRITHHAIATSRGCPHGCEFCAVIQNFGRAYRALSVERAVELIVHQLSQRRAPVFFADDNFTARPRRVKEILTECMRRSMPLQGFSCQVRVEAAFDNELLEIMRRAGCETVMVGFESVNNETLKLYRKGSTLEKNREAIERFHAKGICVHGMFVLGSDADTEETVVQTLRFAKRMNLDTAQFFALTPIPGTPMTRRLTEEGRVLTRAWHLYDAQHVVIEPRCMSAHELQKGIAWAFRRFYSPSEAVRRLFFARGPQHLYNFLIRLLGRHLVNRIIRETLPHQYALRRVESFVAAAERAHRSWRERIAAVHQSLSEGGSSLRGALQRTCDQIQLARERLLEAQKQCTATLRHSLQKIEAEYRPFCMRVLQELSYRLSAEAEELLYDGA